MIAMHTKKNDVMAFNYFSLEYVEGILLLNESIIEMRQSQSGNKIR